MSRRKRLFKRQGERAGSNLPSQTVKGEGRTGFGNRPNSGKGQRVSAPAGKRKRDLVAKWTSKK